MYSKDRLTDRLRIAYLKWKYPQLLFITGAPRSGTTFISDWITESDHAYCAHEVTNELAHKSDKLIFKHLQQNALDGKDRLDKITGNEAMKWQAKPPKSDLKLLGFKEPFCWANAQEQLPYAVGTFLIKYRSIFIVTIRHPYDVIASGKHRGLHTKNWPNYTLQQHCNFWCSTIELCRHWQSLGLKVLYIKWERLMLEFMTVKRELEDFIELQLPVFYGYEQTQSYIEALRQQMTLQEGMVMSNKRSLLDETDKNFIKQQAAQLCAQFDYLL